MNSSEGSENFAPLVCSSKTCRACSGQTDEHLAAYAAGILDGEGSITISSQTNNGRTRYWVMLCVQMAKPGAINVLCRVLGGTAGASHHKPSPNRAAILRWTMAGVQTRCALRVLMPYLRLKRRQAEVAEGMLSREWPRSSNGRGISWMPSVSEQWQEAKDEVERLNARGTAINDPDAIALRVGDRWMKPVRDLFGERWETFSGDWPKSGSMRAGRLYERPTLAPRTDATAGSVSPGLLPTPNAGLHNYDEDPESFLDRRVELAERHGNNGAGMPLGIAAQLLATPTARDHKDGPPCENVEENSLLGRQVWRIG